MGLERGQHRLNEPRVTLDDLLAIEDMEDLRDRRTDLEVAAQNYSDKLDHTMDKRSEEFSDKKNRETMDAIDRRHIK